MGAAARRPLVVAATVVLLALAGAALALRLETRADTETLVGTSTPGYAATERLHERFGDDAVYVVVREPVANVVLTQDLAQVLGLEGCLSGNVPAGRRPRGGVDGPCARLARTKPVKVVFGPGTFLNEAVGQISDQFAAASGRAGAAGRAGVARGLRTGARPRLERRRGAGVRGEGQGSRERAVLPGRPGPGHPLRHHLPAEPERPALHRAPGLRRAARRGRAEGAVRLDLPGQGGRADPGAPARRASAPPSARARSPTSVRPRRCRSGGSAAATSR